MSGEKYVNPYEVLFRPPHLGRQHKPIDPPAEESMEISGFRFIDGGEPSPTEVETIEKAFNKRASQNSTHVAGEKECDEFIESVTHESILKIAKRELHVPPDQLIARQRAIARHDPEHQNGPKTAHPSNDGISFIRVVNGCVGQESLKLYRSSHHQSMEEFHKTHVKAEEPILRPDRVLVMLGTLKWDFNPPSGCKIVSSFAAA
ncbi:hypothetical protein PISL3812_09958 [Talaromyces islandicus]|uniref:Uncharacterized protein n=1 Tax=Talaromyces islandicus TaxID=28573 RepID=A0A0U1MB94_TALIS|nr:hypothetical protein PISL3812_09958 [Talaromyces islandicus]